MVENAQAVRLTVDGHTDATGTEATNLVISQRRAEAVRSVLLEAGVRPERVTAVGSGELRPIASNETRDGRARNRRVEIVLNGFGGSR